MTSMFEGQPPKGHLGSRYVYIYKCHSSPAWNSVIMIFKHVYINIYIYILN